MRAYVLAACLAVLPVAVAHADPVEIVANPSAASGSITEIDIKDMLYAPTTVKVKRGTIVRWKNIDEVAHNVQLRGDPPRAGTRPRGRC